MVFSLMPTKPLITSYKLMKKTNYSLLYPVCWFVTSILALINAVRYGSGLSFLTAILSLVNGIRDLKYWRENRA